MDPEKIRLERVKRYQKLTSDVANGKKISREDFEWLQQVHASALDQSIAHPAKPNEAAPDEARRLTDNVLGLWHAPQHAPNWVMPFLDGVEQGAGAQTTHPVADFATFRSLYPELRPENVQAMMDAFYGNKSGY